MVTVDARPGPLGAVAAGRRAKQKHEDAVLVSLRDGFAVALTAGSLEEREKR
jgi:hypothetical protein